MEKALPSLPRPATSGNGSRIINSDGERAFTQQPSPSSPDRGSSSAANQLGPGYLASHSIPASTSSPDPHNYPDADSGSGASWSWSTKVKKKSLFSKLSAPPPDRDSPPASPLPPSISSPTRSRAGTRNDMSDLEPAYLVTSPSSRSAHLAPAVNMTPPDSPGTPSSSGFGNLGKKRSSGQLLASFGKGLNRVGSVMKRSSGPERVSRPNISGSGEGVGGREAGLQSGWKASKLGLSKQGSIRRQVEHGSWRGRRLRDADLSEEGDGVLVEDMREESEGASMRSTVVVEAETGTVKVGAVEVEKGDEGIGRPFNVAHDLHISPDLDNLPPEWLEALKAQGLTQADLMLIASARKSKASTSDAKSRHPDHPSAAFSRDSHSKSHQLEGASLHSQLSPPSKAGSRPRRAPPALTRLDDSRPSHDSAIRGAHSVTPTNDSQSRLRSSTPTSPRLSPPSAFSSPTKSTRNSIGLPSPSKRLSGQLRGFAALKLDEVGSWADDVFDLLGKDNEDVPIQENIQLEVGDGSGISKAQSTAPHEPLISSSRQRTISPKILPRSPRSPRTPTSKRVSVKLRSGEKSDKIHQTPALESAVAEPITPTRGTRSASTGRTRGAYDREGAPSPDERAVQSTSPHATGISPILSREEKKSIAASAHVHSQSLSTSEDHEIRTPSTTEDGEDIVEHVARRGVDERTVAAGKVSMDRHGVPYLADVGGQETDTLNRGRSNTLGTPLNLSLSAPEEDLSLTHTHAGSMLAVHPPATAFEESFAPSHARSYDRLTLETLSPPRRLGIDTTFNTGEPRLSGSGVIEPPSPLRPPPRPRVSLPASADGTDILSRPLSPVDGRMRQMSIGTDILDAYGFGPGESEDDDEDDDDDEDVGAEAEQVGGARRRESGSGSALAYLARVPSELSTGEFHRGACSWGPGGRDINPQTDRVLGASDQAGHNLDLPFIRPDLPSCASAQSTTSPPPTLFALPIPTQGGMDMHGLNISQATFGIPRAGSVSPGALTSTTPLARRQAATPVPTPGHSGEERDRASVALSTFTGESDADMDVDGDLALRDSLRDATVQTAMKRRFVPLGAEGAGAGTEESGRLSVFTLNGYMCDQGGGQPGDAGGARS